MHSIWVLCALYVFYILISLDFLCRLLNALTAENEQNVRDPTDDDELDGEEPPVPEEVDDMEELAKEAGDDYDAAVMYS